MESHLEVPQSTFSAVVLSLPQDVSAIRSRGFDMSTELGDAATRKKDDRSQEPITCVQSIEQTQRSSRLRAKIRDDLSVDVRPHLSTTLELSVSSWRTSVAGGGDYELTSGHGSRCARSAPRSRSSGTTPTICIRCLAHRAGMLLLDATCSRHFHPGSSVARAMVMPPRRTSVAEGQAVSSIRFPSGSRITLS